MDLNKLKTEAPGLIEWGICHGLITRPGRQMSEEEQVKFLLSWNRYKKIAKDHEKNANH